LYFGNNDTQKKSFWNCWCKKYHYVFFIVSIMSCDIIGIIDCKSKTEAWKLKSVRDTDLIQITLY